MKKLLALGLSMTMMASLSAVAFAADANWQGMGGSWAEGSDGTTVIKVKAEDEGGQPVEGKFTVTIPAEFEFYWEQPSQTKEGSIRVIGQLPAGDSVTVVGKNNAEVALNNADSTHNLKAYVTSTEVTATSDNILDGVNGDVTVGIEDWSNVPIDNYQGSTQFEVTYNDASADVGA